MFHCNSSQWGTSPGAAAEMWTRRVHSDSCLTCRPASQSLCFTRKADFISFHKASSKRVCVCTRESKERERLWCKKKTSERKGIRWVSKKKRRKNLKSQQHYRFFPAWYRPSCSAITSLPHSFIFSPILCLHPARQTAAERALGFSRGSGAARQGGNG